MTKDKSPDNPLKAELNRIFEKVSQPDCPKTAVASAKVSHVQALDLVEKQTPQYLSKLANEKIAPRHDRRAAAVFRLALKVAKEKKRGMDALLDEINKRILAVNPEKKGVSKRNLYRLIERHKISSGRSVDRGRAWSDGILAVLTA